MKLIYRFYMDCGRAGDLEGVFAVNDAGEALLEDLITSGNEICYGEVLGKHSDVVGTLERSELTIATEVEADVDTVLRVLGIPSLDGHRWQTISGFCPLDYADLD